MSEPKPETNRPTQFARVVFIFAGIGFFVLAIGPSHLLSPMWWQGQPAGDKAAVVASACVGLLVGVLASRDIWRLSERVTPRWKTILTVLVALIVVSFMIYVREAGIWLWSLAIGDALVVTGSFTVAAVAVFVERRERVRIYASASRFSFVPVVSDA